MPQISIGKKGPPGPPLKSGKFVCPKYDKVFVQKCSLKSHCLSRHAWSLETNAVASLEQIKDFRRKQQQAVERRYQLALAKTTAVESARRAENALSATVESLIGTISSDSQEVTVEPQDIEQDAEIRKETPKSTDKSAITGWSTTPTPLSETTNPCQRKKFEAKMPPVAIKKYVAVTGTHTDARSKEVQTDTTA